MDKEKPDLKVVTLEQPQSIADAAMTAYNSPENIENVHAQAAMDAHHAKVRYDAFVAQGFNADQALKLVIEGVIF